MLLHLGGYRDIASSNETVRAIGNRLWLRAGILIGSLVRNVGLNEKRVPLRYMRHRLCRIYTKFKSFFILHCSIDFFQRVF